MRRAFEGVRRGGAWRGLRVLAPLALALAGGACGYSAGLRVKDSGLTSIGVEFFGNETLERDLERDFHAEFTRALRDAGAELEREPRALNVIRGTVREYHRRSGIRSTDNRLLETGVYFAVEAALYTGNAEKPVRGPYQANTWVGFVIEPTGENERMARERAMRHVAEELVLDLLTPVN